MIDALVSATAQAVARALTLGGIMTLVGGAIFVIRIAPRHPRDSTQSQQEHARLTTLLRATVLLLAIIAACRLVQQSAIFADAPSEWATMAPVVLFQMTWGTGWKLLVAGVVLACVAAITGSHTRPARFALGAGALVAAASPSFMGHAVGSEPFTVQAVVADTVHVIGAGAWLGTLLVIAVASLAPTVNATALSVLGALERFSPVALTSAALVASTGAFASWLHLQTLGALWTSTYGQTLLLKLAILAGVAAAGAYNWRVTTPRLREAGDVRGLRRSALVELALALALVAVTAVLVATPLPGEM